jgi:PD-(D/E)XK nuclease superfamily
MGRPSDGYRLADGTPIPGTTTILGRFKDSGALIKWAYKQGREHERLAMQGKPAPRHLHEVVDAAAQAGTIAHNLIESEILGREVEPIPKNAAPDVVRRAQRAFSQAMRWLQNSKVEIVETEMPLVHEELRYGGTPDAIGRYPDGAIVLIDYKTSNAIYADYLLQLAAYDILLRDVRKIECDSFEIMRFSKENALFSHHSWGNMDVPRRAFLLMRELYAYDEQLKKLMQ